MRRKPSIVVVAPAAILAGGDHGANDLYVALTRTTARLGVVHAGELLPVLSRLADRKFAGIPAADGR